MDVAFKDKKGNDRIGRITRKNPTNARVHVDGVGDWRMSYFLMRKANAEECEANHCRIMELPREPVFGVGDNVRFGKPRGRKFTGRIVKSNRKSYGVLNDADNRVWTVSKGLVEAA